MTRMRRVPPLIIHAIVEEGQAAWQRSLTAAEGLAWNRSFSANSMQACQQPLTAAVPSRGLGPSASHAEQHATPAMPAPLGLHTLSRGPQGRSIWPTHGGQHWLTASRQQQQLRFAKTKVIVEYKPLPEPARDRYSSEPTNYLQLLGAIRHANSTDRLKYLIQNYAGVFDAALLANAFSRLPKLAKYKPEDLVRSVVTHAPRSGSIPALGRLIPRPGTLPRPSYRQAASSLAFQLMAMTVGHSNVQVPKATALSSSPAIKHPTVRHGIQQGLSLWKLKAPTNMRMGQAKQASSKLPLATYFMPQHAASCIATLGLLHSMGVQLDRKLVVATSDLVLDILLAPERAGESALQVHGTAEDVAHILKGLAQLKPWPHRRDVLQQLAAFCNQHADKMQALTVQMVLRSLVNLGYTEAVVLGALAARARCIAKNFTPTGIMHVLRALSAAQPATATHDSTLKDTQAAGQATLRALAAGVAPQLVLMSPADLSGLAASLGQLGRSYVRHGAFKRGLLQQDTKATGLAGEGQHEAATQTGAVGAEGIAPGAAQETPAGRAAVGNPAGLPSWLHSLACLLTDKAVRDMSQLQPEQLASVLSMAASLQLPHTGLIQTVTDGILVEHELDPTLPVSVGAAVINALSVLLPLMSEAQKTEPGVQDKQATLRTLLGHAQAQAPPAALRYRQTAEGLGNLTGTADPSELVNTGFGPLQETGANTSHLLSTTGGRPRQYYQQLLISATPLQDKMLAAAQRVAEVFTAAGAFSNATIYDLAELATALRAATTTWPATPLLGFEQLQAMSNQATDVLQADAQALQSASITSDLSSHQALRKLTHVVQLLQHLDALHQQSATLSAAAAMYVKSLLEGQPQMSPQLLPTCIALLTACRQHGAEPTSASKTVAQAYAGVLGQAGTAPASPWPTHTASGLAPTPTAAQSKLQPWANVNGPMLAQLLQVCAANGTLDSSILNAVATHLPQLLSKDLERGGRRPAGASAEEKLEWLVGCSSALAQEAEHAQQGRSQLSQADFVSLEQLVSQLTERLQAKPQITTLMHSKLQALQQQLAKVGDSSSQPKGLDQVLLQLVGVAEKVTEKVGPGTSKLPMKPAVSRQVLDNFQAVLSSLK